jgi:hypothetical protein
MAKMTNGKRSVVLVASTTAPAGPSDVVGLATEKIGCQIERFLAPVEPGNLLLMGYEDDIPIMSAPGCFRSFKPNVIDPMLPPMLARYRVSTWEVACLGHGGPCWGAALCAERGRQGSIDKASVRADFTSARRFITGSCLRRWHYREMALFRASRRQQFRLFGHFSESKAQLEGSFPRVV